MPLPVVPPSFHLRLRVVTAEEARRPPGTSLAIAHYANKPFRVRRGDVTLAEGSVDEEGFAAADLGDEGRAGVLEIGERDAGGAFTPRLAIPYAELPPSVPANPVLEIAMRMVNLGLATGFSQGELEQAVERFVFQHQLTTRGADAGRFGSWLEASSLLSSPEHTRALLAELVRRHDS